MEEWVRKGHKRDSRSGSLNYFFKLTVTTYGRTHAWTIIEFKDFVNCGFSKVQSY